MLDLGKSTEAITHFREALRRRPDYAEAYNNLANALKGLGKLEEAAASYREALRLQPSFPEAYHNLGLVLAEQNKHAEAIGKYQEAIRLKPDYADAYASLGAALVDTIRQARKQSREQMMSAYRSFIPAGVGLDGLFEGKADVSGIFDDAVRKANDILARGPAGDLRQAADKRGGSHG